MASTQTCSIPDCDAPVVFRTHKRPSWCSVHLDDRLAEKNLLPVEAFPGRRKPWMMLCSECGYETHHYLDRALKHRRPCTVCQWRTWEQGIPTLVSDPELVPLTISANIPLVSTEEAAANAGQYGFQYIGRVENPPMPRSDIHLVECRHCGVRKAQRTGDITGGCQCRNSTAAPSGARKAGQKRYLRDEPVAEKARHLWDEEANAPGLWDTLTFRARSAVAWRCPDCGHRWQASPAAMSKSLSEWGCPACYQRGRDAAAARREQYRGLMVSDVAELVQAWADDADPAQVPVLGGWQLFRFRCPAGHYPRQRPWTMLESGCPTCRGLETKRRRAEQAAQAPAQTRLDPEVASQWHPSKNTRSISSVGPDSRTVVWWRDPVCGHEWDEMPRTRRQGRQLRCPECETVLGSLAWMYPEVAEEWSPENPVTPWHVRPSGRITFTPFWVCKTDPGHRWQASITSRANGGQCPKCVGYGSSAVELRYHAAAERVFGEARSGSAIYSEAFTARRRWVVDVCMDALSPGYRGVVVEFDGSYWHRDKAAVDTAKSLDLLAAGYLVVRLRETPLEALPVDDPRYSEISVQATSDPDTVMRRVFRWVESAA